MRNRETVLCLVLLCRAKLLSNTRIFRDVHVFEARKQIEINQVHLKVSNRIIYRISV